MKAKILNLSIGKKIIILLVVGVIGWFVYLQLFSSTATTTEYQTEKVKKGNLTVTVTASGAISSANSANVTTEASGVVKKILVKDGGSVKQGDKIAEIELDMSGKQRETQALASYQSAKNSLESARANLYSTQATMFTAWDKHYNLATNSTYENDDGSPTANRTLPEFNISNDTWLAAEANYKNQKNVVNQAQIALNSSWISYQQASPVIYAPISGTITGLALQEGAVISQTVSSTTTQSNTNVASVITSAKPTVSLALTEIDIPKINIGNTATITVDAFPDKTFTGQVSSINKVGSTSSGVTTYSVIVRLDTDANYLLPNMAANVTIITQTKKNVLLVPQSAVQTQDDATFVRIMENNQPVETPVETGLSSETEVEIISGVSEGDIVVTSIVQTGSSSTQTQTSPFSPFGNTRIRTR